MGQVLSDAASTLAGGEQAGGEWQGRDASADLGASIGETYRYLASERPEMLEEDAVRRAIELSMLDCALVLRGGGSRVGEGTAGAVVDSGKPYGARGDRSSAEEVLRVPPGASLEEIRAAYRRRARETHPDKGGESGEFEAVARAYRSLLDAPMRDGGSRASSRHLLPLDASRSDESSAVLAITDTAHWDNELREHKTLVRELFEAHGADIGAVLSRQEAALRRMGLAAKDAGSRGRNEKDEVILNSCFYISLAASYLSGIGVLASRAYTSGDGGGALRAGGDDDEGATDREEEALRRADEALMLDSALQLKRIIEAAVVSAHPEWAAEGLVGEEVQAFSDFLVYVLDSPTLVSEWAVAIFDSASGFVDVYKGKNFPEDDEEWAKINTLTIRYEPGHYQPILPTGFGSSKRRPALGEMLEVLNNENVIYVVTDGSA